MLKEINSYSIVGGKKVAVSVMIVNSTSLLFLSQLGKKKEHRKGWQLCLEPSPAFFKKNGV